MVWSDAGEYDECRCGGALEPRSVEVRINDGETVLDGVPQVRCLLCGSCSYRSFQIAVLETLQKREQLASARDVW